MITILIKNLREQAKRRSLSGYTKCLLNCAADALQDDLETMGTRVKVVQCKDCVHWEKSKVIGNRCVVFDWFSKKNDYCSFAERRSE